MCSKPSANPTTSESDKCTSTSFLAPIKSTPEFSILSPCQAQGVQTLRWSQAAATVDKEVVRLEAQVMAMQGTDYSTNAGDRPDRCESTMMVMIDELMHSE